MFFWLLCTREGVTSLPLCCSWGSFIDVSNLSGSSSVRRSYINNSENFLRVISYWYRLFMSNLGTFYSFRVSYGRFVSSGRRQITSLIRQCVSGFSGEGHTVRSECTKSTLLCCVCFADTEISRTFKLYCPYSTSSSTQSCIRGAHKPVELLRKDVG